MSKFTVSAHVTLSLDTELGSVKKYDTHDSFDICDPYGGLLFVGADSVEAIDRFSARLAELREAVAERRDQTTPPEPKRQEPL